MAGYAARTSPASGTLLDLYVRVLALEDADGRRAVLVSCDLLGIPRSISEHATRALKEKFGLPREAVMLNASHTHCGPVLRGALYDAYPLDDVEKKKIDAYSNELESTLVRTVGEALAQLVPASVAVGQGETDFAVNRRNNREPDVPALQGQPRAPRTDRSLGSRAGRSACRRTIAGGCLWLCLPQHNPEHPTMERRLRRFCRKQSGGSAPRRDGPVLHGLRGRPESDPATHHRTGEKIWPHDDRRRPGSARR